MGRLEDSVWKLVLFFYHMGPQDQTQVGTFGSKLLYHVNLLTALVRVSVSSTTGLFKDRVAWQSVGFRMVFRELGLSSPPKPTPPRSPGSLHLISVGSSG